MRKSNTLILTIIFLYFFTTPAFSAYTWIGGADIWSDPTKWDCFCVPGPGDHVIIPAGVVDLEGIDYTVLVVSLSGGEIIAGGGGTLTVTGGMDWTGGTIFGEVIIGGSLDMSGAAPKILKGVLEIAFGSVVGWDDGPFLMDGGFLLNSGTFVIESDHDIAEGVFLGSIENDGIFIKTLGGATTDVDAFFENHFPGEVKVESGRLSMNKGFYNDYKVTIDALAAFEVSFDGTFDVGSALGGLGKLNLSGDTSTYIVPYDGALDIELNGSVVFILMDLMETTGEITLDDASLDGPGTLHAKGLATWKEGKINFDATLKIATSGSLTISTVAVKQIYGTLDLEGPTSWTGGDIDMYGMSLIDNSSTLSTDFDGDLAVKAPGGIITNSGTIKKTAGGGITTIEQIITNSGTIEAEADTIMLSGMLTNTGALGALTASCNITFTGGSSWSAGADMTGSGDMDFKGGTHTFSTPISSSNWIGFLDGTCTINADLTNDNKVNLNSPGEINGSASLICEGEMNFVGGIMDVPVSIENTGDIEIFSSDSKTILDVLTVKGEGFLYSSATDFEVNDPGSISNLGTFYLEGGADILKSGTAGSFSNGGTLVKNSLSTSFLDIDLSSSGTIKGIGTLDPAGTFVNLGITEPGTSPGILTIDDDFTGGTQINIEIKDDSGAGTGHDQLIVTGTISLEDSLSVVEIGTVPDGTYTIISCTGGANCLTGTFEKVTLPANYAINYNPESVTITKNSVLPVELNYFNGIANGADVLLSWETQSEQNNNYFQIERSSDGRTFLAIGVVDGLGNSSSKQSYFYNDENILKDQILNTIYYRLKQIDQDGHYEYTPIIAISVQELEKAWSIRVVPKSSNYMQVVYDSQLQKKVHLTIFEISGKQLLKQEIEILKGSGAIDLYTGDMVSGFYLVQMAAGKFQVSQPFFKTH